MASFISQTGDQRFITLNLRNGDFTTIQRIGDVINTSYPGIAVALDASTVKVAVPSTIAGDGLVRFLDDITLKEVTVDAPAVVVINGGTGTIVVGENVGISAVAISQGSLVVKVKETLRSRNLVRLSRIPARPKSIPDTQMTVDEQNAYLIPVSVR